MGTEPVGMPSEGLAQKIKQDRAVAERVAKEANIRVN
jgi:hypothetical protein